MFKPVIAGFSRSPFTMARKGALVNTKPVNLLAEVIKNLVAKSNVKKEDIEDIVVGCAFQTGEQSFNIGKLTTFLTNMDVKTSGMTVDRWCGSSMEAIHIAAGKISLGAGKVFICGGVESMSRVTAGFNPMPFPKLDEENPKIVCQFLTKDFMVRNNMIDEGDKEMGIIPAVLSDVLGARKSTKKRMNQEKDDFKKKVLDGLQLAYKVTANSLYGGVGAEVSSLYYKDIAASTTAVGRRHLHLAKDYVKEHYPNADIVYGDTDSIFVNFNVHKGLEQELSNSEALQKSIDLSVEVENGIQSLLEYPHKLEYEKTFYPFLLLRKKGYVGNKYEFDLNKYKQSSMGVVTKRRDNAPIVKYVYDGIIKRIMNDRDIQACLLYTSDAADE